MAPTCHDANDAAATLVGIGAWADPHLLALQSQGCKPEPRESDSPVRPELVYGALSEQPKSVYISTPSVEVDPCRHQIEAGKQAQALSRRNDAQHWVTPVEPKARRLSHIKAARGGRSQPECHDSKERSPTYLVDILDIGSAKSMDQGRTVRHVWHGVRLFCKRLSGSPLLICDVQV